MSNFTYAKILKRAKEIITNVKKNYELGISSQYSYYFAKAILTPKKDIKKIGVNDAPKPQGTSISRTVTKADYLDIVKRYVKFVESDSKHRLPDYVSYGKHKIRPQLATLVFAKILVSYHKNGKLPDTVNINSKAFTKPSETSNAVYDYFAKKTGKKFKTIDDLLTYIKAHGRYIFEFDDVRSNKEVINCMCGNCTDWLQFLVNYAEAMGYEWKVLHVKCRVSGTGHVRGQFKHSKHTGGKWIYRDPAAVADGGSITSNWCMDGTLLATNPDWFLANKNR